jgi:MFS family permease
MSRSFVTSPFILVSSCNFFLFLIVATWSFLPLFIVDVGGDERDVGLVMGALGITSLGALPFVAPLIDRYGRKFFITLGAFIAGVSNLGYLAFDSYTHWFALMRLLQGFAFACCFNACLAAVVDIAPIEKRGQAIGWFGVSGSLAFAIGPFLGEETIMRFGFQAYFMLLCAFGSIGALLGLRIHTARSHTRPKNQRGFFGTAIEGKYPPMMMLALTFGSAFAAMNTFFPLYAAGIGLRAGYFYVAYGITLVIVRLTLARLTDIIHREKIIFVCFVSFTALLAGASGIFHIYHTVILGCVFGMIQALCYPAMMARMVDRSDESNRGVVVSLFTGSMGMGINLSAFGWGYIADIFGLSMMYIVAAAIMATASVIIFRHWRSAILGL